MTSKSKLKKWMLLSLAGGCIMASVSGCGGDSSQSQSTGKASSTAVYDYKIEEYKTVMTMGKNGYKNWRTTVGLTTVNKNYMNLAYMYGGMTINSALYDINKDGTPELLIATDNTIIDIYTILDKVPVGVLKPGAAGERARIHVLEDGKIVYEGSGGADRGFMEISRLEKNGKRTVEKQIVADGKNSVLGERNGKTYVTAEELGKQRSELTKKSVFGKIKWQTVATMPKN